MPSAAGERQHVAPNSTGAVAGRGARHRQGSLHLRLPARGQLPVQYSYFVDRSQPGVQGPLEPRSTTTRGSTRPTTRRSRRRTPTRRTRFSARTCAPSRWCSPCRRSRRAATTRCSSSTCTPSTSPTSAAAPPATAAGSYLLAGPRWKGEKPAGIKAVIRSRDGVRLRALPHAALRPGRHRERQEGPGRLQGRSRCRRSSGSRHRAARRPSTS